MSINFKFMLNRYMSSFMNRLSANVAKKRKLQSESQSVAERNEVLQSQEHKSHTNVSTVHINDDNHKVSRACSKLTTADNFHAHQEISKNKTMPEHSKHTKREAQILEDVVKSPNDSRKYRAVKLTNGLQILLVSDMQRKEHDQLETSQETDADTCHTSKLPEGEKLSAAALCIGNGSFSDPPDIPGLAHFLEHMVFMGSEKYPDENEFDAFVKKNGGNSNAFTDCERTVFYFDIKKNYFPEALDRFAQFFISPLMKQNSVDREIEAVDSEFEMSVTSDSSRKEQLLGSVARDGHPMGKFMWGNAETLKNLPSRENIDIYLRLKEFHSLMYSAHYMTLAVQSRDSLDDLQNLIVKTFSDVPQNGITRQSYQDAQFQKPFDTPEFYKIYRVVPVKNIHQIELTWALPCLMDSYRVKPLHYIGWLIGHEGKGSILSFLRKKLWALSLEGGNGESGFEFNSTWSEFCINITLTETGIKNVYQVLTAVFQYLAMLRKVGPQAHIYKEIQTIEANEFRWQEQSEPADYVEKLCENMQLYPVAEYLTGDCLLQDYDEKLLRKCQDMLVPDEARILIFSKHHANICQLQEPWFKTAYSVSDIPQDWLESWKNLELNPAFHLPAENLYMATDFSMKSADMPLSQFPVAIVDNKQSRLWYKKDVLFKVPKAYIYFSLSTPVVNSSACSLAMAELFVRILEENLSEVAYAAHVAQLSYHLEVCQRGVNIRLNGFNHKLPILFETIVDHMADFSVSEDLFNTIKDQKKKAYYNHYIKPKSLSREVRRSILEERFWTSVEKCATLDSITLDMLLQFVTDLKREMFVEGLIFGNFTSKESKYMEQYLLTKLACTPLSDHLKPKLCVNDLPLGDLYCRVENLNQSDVNSVITNYYQHGPASLKEFVIHEAVFMHMEEPCFDILRTQKQLGYDVSCTYNNTHNILGFSVTVCSQATKHSMSDLDKHVEDFLLYYEGVLQKMTHNEFTTLIQAMITLKKCEDSHMGEEAGRHWNEIIRETYDFNVLQKQIELLEKVTVEEIRHWYLNLVPLGGKHKKLSIQVVGTNRASTNTQYTAEEDEEEEVYSEDEEDLSGSEKDSDSSGEEDMSIDVDTIGRDAALAFLPVEEELKTKSICDIKKFRDSCQIYPPSKIL